MSVTSVIPVVASVATLFAGLTIAAIDFSRWRGAWVIPAVASVLFFLFSLATVVLEGPLGFWPLHTRSLWGNQVWVDLLLAATVGFAALTPRARALRMPPVPWFAFVACTGSIGLLAMAARVLYLHDRTTRRA